MGVAIRRKRQAILFLGRDGTFFSGLTKTMRGGERLPKITAEETCFFLFSDGRRRRRRRRRRRVCWLRRVENNRRGERRSVILSRCETEPVLFLSRGLCSRHNKPAEWSEIMLDGQKHAQP